MRFNVAAVEESHSNYRLVRLIKMVYRWTRLKSIIFEPSPPLSIVGGGGWVSSKGFETNTHMHVCERERRGRDREVYHKKNENACHMFHSKREAGCRNCTHLYI